MAVTGHVVLFDDGLGETRKVRSKVVGVAEGRLSMTRFTDDSTIQGGAADRGSVGLVSYQFYALSA